MSELRWSQGCDRGRDRWNERVIADLSIDNCLMDIVGLCVQEQSLLWLLTQFWSPSNINLLSLPAEDVAGEKGWSWSWVYFGKLKVSIGEQVECFGRFCDGYISNGEFSFSSLKIKTKFILALYKH